MTFEDLSKASAEAISSNSFPESIESKNKPKGRDRKKKDKKEAEAPVEEEEKPEEQ
jgi:hypothetical protein